MTPEREKVVRDYAAKLALRRAEEATTEHSADRWLDTAARIERGQALRWTLDGFSAVVSSDLFGWQAAEVEPEVRRIINGEASE